MCFLDKCRNSVIEEGFARNFSLRFLLFYRVWRFRKFVSSAPVPHNGLKFLPVLRDKTEISPKLSVGQKVLPVLRDRSKRFTGSSGDLEVSPCLIEGLKILTGQSNDLEAYL